MNTSCKNVLYILEEGGRRVVAAFVVVLVSGESVGRKEVSEAVQLARGCIPAWDSRHCPRC